MHARIPAILLFSSVLLIAVVYVMAVFTPLTPFSTSLLAVGISGASVSVMGFGLPRHSRRARVIVTIALVTSFLLTSAGFILALRTTAPGVHSRLIFGLPAGAAAIIYLVGLLPLVALPIIYAFTFDDQR